MEGEQKKIYLFSGTIILIHLAYIAIFFGVIYVNERYIKNLSILVQLGVCLFIIYRFSPLRQLDRFTKLDQSVIFYCATFLLMNVVAIEVYESFIRPVIGDLQHVSL
jgi:hypothetical protein